MSGEHGIGLSKAPYLGMELSDAVIETMKKIKVSSTQTIY